MKRWPLIASFVLFLLLCASVAYWGLQLFKPPLRPVAAPPRAAAIDVRPEAGAALFGGRAGKVAVASNYQLRGVVMSGSPRDSVAIVSADGKPAQAVRVDAELSPGVVVKEVHRDYVLLSEGGVVKRVELPENAVGQAGIATAAPVPVSRAAVAPPPQSPLSAPPAPTSRPSAAQPPSQPPAQATPQAPSPASPVVVNPPPAPTAPTQQSPQFTPQQPTATAPLPPAVVGIVPPPSTPTPAQPITVPGTAPGTLGTSAPAPARSAPLSTSPGEMRDAPLQSR
jgi:general secretion pathway protein C